tara:strand:+ start:32 stop:229 length:198 start_codon:yes stop_codon:yes gene_type:complete
MNIYDLPSSELELDESILRMKELTKRLQVEHILNPTSDSVDTILEIISLIQCMDVPIRMNEEGLA